MRTVIVSVALLLALTPIASAQGRTGRRPGPPGPGVVEPMEGSRIVWFATLESALAEAKRSDRPIFVVSAAPQCHGTPGIW